MPDKRQQLINLIDRLNDRQVTALLQVVRVLLEQHDSTPSVPPSPNPVPEPEPAPPVTGSADSAVASFIDDYLTGDHDIGDDWAEKLKLNDT